MATTTTLKTAVQTARDGQGTVGTNNFQGLLSKLKVGASLYGIKDPAVEALATAMDNELDGVQSKIEGVQSQLTTATTFTEVAKGSETKKYVGAVTQGTQGQVGVTYVNLRDTALVGSQTAGQYVTSVSQDVDGVVSVTTGGVAGEHVTYGGTQVTATNVDDAIDAVVTKLVGDATNDTKDSDTIAGAKKYADEAVNALAGTDWTEAARTVKDIIDELEGQQGVQAWTTVADKVRGDFNYVGTQGTATDVKSYIDVKFAEVQAAASGGISDLDAVVYGAQGATGATGETAGTAYSGDTSSLVAVKITEVDGKLTAVDVKTNDVATISTHITGVQGQITDLNSAVVKKVNNVSPVNNEVTVYASDIKVSDAAGANTIATELSNLASDKANKAAITTATINPFTSQVYTAGTEELALTFGDTSVYVPVTGQTL